MTGVYLVVLYGQRVKWHIDNFIEIHGGKREMVKLFTHTDLDGIGCSILGHLAFGDTLDVEYCNYDDINEKISNFLESGQEFNELYITDISVNEELAIAMSSIPNIFLYDHHPTASYLNAYSWATVSCGGTVCGTDLFYDALVKKGYLLKDKGISEFVEHVSNWDTWKWAVMGEDGLISKRYNDLFGLYGRDKFIDWVITKLVETRTATLGPREFEILDILQNNIDRYVEIKNSELTKGVSTITNTSTSIGVVFADKYISELGNKLCELNEDLDLVAMVDVGARRLHFRTIKDTIDVGAFAKLLGGGGHSRSAGVTFSENISVSLDIGDGLFKVKL